MFPAEIRYLDITWSNPGSVVNINKAREAIDCEQLVDGWLVNTVTFPSMFNSIGIRVTDNELKHVPYIKLADGTQQELLRIKSPGGEGYWWIHSNGWSSKHKRHLSELYRTAGRTEVIVQGKRLTLLNHTFNFSVYELEQYLADFKNSLWMLILDNASIARAGVSKPTSGLASESLLKSLDEFVQKVESLIQNPNVFLTETQERLPVRSVKPVARTFREFAVNPQAKRLTSRSYQESYDTSENRYVHYCVERVRYLLNALLRTVVAQRTSFEQRIAQEEEWGNQLKKEKSFKRINPKIYENEIFTLQNKISDLNQNLSNILISEERSKTHFNAQFGEYTIELGKKYQSSQGKAFFVKRLNGKDFQETFGTYLLVWFPERVMLPNSGSILNFEFTIKGFYRKTNEKNRKGVKFFNLIFDNICSVSIASHPLLREIDRLHAKISVLELNDWCVRLSNAELKEREADIRASDYKIALYKNMSQSIEVFSEHIPRLKFRSVKLCTFFNKHRVKKRSSCPNSMTFIQNPIYAGAKGCFKKIMDQSSLNESLLSSLMVVDDIGLVNIANLYERWCLLKIINVLTDNYGFILSDGWQEKLISLVLKKTYNIELKFYSSQRQLNITLTYEMVLPNRKRPDFVIDLFSKEYQQNPNTLDWFYVDEKKSRIVLDSKFRGDVSEKHINNLIGELYSDKDYSEGGRNQVFVVHPTPNVIQDLTSPLVWGECCNYGQVENHKNGAIFLSPTKKFGDTTKNLQRLIGMFLQENSTILKPLDDERGVQARWSNIPCISCGNTADDSLNVTYSPTKRGGERWEILCDKCGLVTVKTICLSCHKPLYKNGPQWTYHRTRAEKISNVVCPSCNKFLGAY